jgi:hypothetical protein
MIRRLAARSNPSQNHRVGAQDVLNRVRHQPSAYQADPLPRGAVVCASPHCVLCSKGASHTHVGWVRLGKLIAVDLCQASATACEAPSFLLVATEVLALRTGSKDVRVIGGGGQWNRCRLTRIRY